MKITIISHPIVTGLLENLGNRGADSSATRLQQFAPCQQKLCKPHEPHGSHTAMQTTFVEDLPRWLYGRLGPCTQRKHLNLRRGTGSLLRH